MIVNVVCHTLKNVDTSLLFVFEAEEFRLALLLFIEYLSFKKPSVNT